MKRPTHCAMAALTAVVAALLISSGCNHSGADRGSGDEGDDSDALVFASVPSQESANLQQSYQPILDMLTEETGQEIRFMNATDYDAIIEGLRDGEIDIAAVGPFSYVLARWQGAQITVVAAQVEEKGEQPGYRSYGFALAGSPIKTLADFRSKTVCFVDPNSASGYLYPSAGLLTAGVNPEQDTTPRFVGGHDASVLAVANRKCDAGFAFDTMVERQLIEQRQIQSGQIATVWKSEVIPGAPMVISNRLSPVLRQQLTTAIQQKANADYLRANDFCQGECGIADDDAYGYVATNDAFYDSLREVCRIVRHESCTER